MAMPARYIYSYHFCKVVYIIVCGKSNIRQKSVFTLQKSEKEWLIVRGHMTSTPNREV